jgi:hypothetical protein
LFRALLVGSYGNLVLYIIEVYAVIQYRSTSKKHKQDTLLLQVMVYFAFLCDTVCTVDTFAGVYLYTITHWGDIDYLFKINWQPGPSILLITSGISALIAQCFLIYRYWKLSSNKYITVILAITMLSAFGVFLGAVVFIIVKNATQTKLVLFVKLWSSASLATDVAIAVALLWQLSRMKSPFRHTQSLIYRLMACTVGTGAVTSVVVVVFLITYLINVQNNGEPIATFQSSLKPSHWDRSASRSSVLSWPTLHPYHALQPEQ